MEWIVFVHVLSAVIGLGPGYVFPVMLRKDRSLAEVIRTTNMVSKLEIFPKVFGTLALISGLILYWLGDYGTILSLWLGGTLILFLIAEVVIIGFLAPAAKKLAILLSRLRESGASETNEESLLLLAKVRNFHTVAGVLTTLILVLMVIKPV